jgi:hypothetical protein
MQEYTMYDSWAAKYNNHHGKEASLPAPLGHAEEHNTGNERHL